MESEAFAAEVTRRARSFDLKALLDLLARNGYPASTVVFRGHHEGGASSLVESVEFSDDRATVLVTVNFGLLGDEALLPSYFVREAERSPDPDAFFDFVAFFEHGLIKNYVAAVWPEDDRTVFADYPLLRTAFLAIGGVASVASLTWLVQLLFPEVPVLVSRATFPDAVATESFHTGLSRLDGTGVLGDRFTLDVDGFLVELTVEDEVDSRGRIWAKVLRPRILDTLVPLLARQRVAVCVRLHVRSHTSWLHLEQEHQRKGFLGYDRLRTDVDDGHTVLLWQGTAGVSRTT